MKHKKATIAPLALTVALLAACGPSQSPSESPQSGPSSFETLTITSQMLAELPQEGRIQVDLRAEVIYEFEYDAPEDIDFDRIDVIDHEGRSRSAREMLDSDFAKSAGDRTVLPAKGFRLVGAAVPED